MTHGGAERPAAGRPYVPDARDWTMEPPAYLDPKWILTMRRRLAAAQVEGYRPWPYWGDFAQSD